MDIEANLMAYLGGREPTERYASFDCASIISSYIVSSRDCPISFEGMPLQLSCLQLGFYLASSEICAVRLTCSSEASKRSSR